MEFFTVSFFGHREIISHFEAEKKLTDIIKELLLTKEYVEFLVGRDGDFDILTASVVRRVKKELNSENCSLVLVLPYMKAEFRDNEESFLNYYDNVEIDGESSGSYYKAAIKIRNQHMIDRSQLLICFVERNQGGAYTAMKYAKKNGCTIINLADTTNS